MFKNLIIVLIVCGLIYFTINEKKNKIPLTIITVLTIIYLYHMNYSYKHDLIEGNVPNEQPYKSFYTYFAREKNENTSKTSDPSDPGSNIPPFYTPNNIDFADLTGQLGFISQEFIRIPDKYPFGRKYGISYIDKWLFRFKTNDKGQPDFGGYKSFQNNQAGPNLNDMDVQTMKTEYENGQYIGVGGSANNVGGTYFSIMGECPNKSRIMHSSPNANPPSQDKGAVSQCDSSTNNGICKGCAPGMYCCTADGYKGACKTKDAGPFDNTFANGICNKSQCIKGDSSSSGNAEAMGGGKCKKSSGTFDTDKCLTDLTGNSLNDDCWKDSTGKKFTRKIIVSTVEEDLKPGVGKAKDYPIVAIYIGTLRLNDVANRSDDSSDDVIGTKPNADDPIFNNFKQVYNNHSTWNNDYSKPINSDIDCKMWNELKISQPISKDSLAYKMFNDPNLWKAAATGSKNENKYLIRPVQTFEDKISIVNPNNITMLMDDPNPQPPPKKRNNIIGVQTIKPPGFIPGRIGPQPPNDSPGNTPSNTPDNPNTIPGLCCGPPQCKNVSEKDCGITVGAGEMCNWKEVGPC